MRLSAICSISPGFTARTRLEPAESGGVLALQLRDIAQNGAMDSTHLSRVALRDVSDKYFVRSGDVVFRSRGDWSVASAVGPDLPEPALAVMPIFILRAKADIVDPEYMAWSINQAPAQRYFDLVAQGGNMRMISRAALETLDLEIPPLQTQRHIVEVHRLAERERVLTIDLANMRNQFVTRRLVDLSRTRADLPKFAGY